MPTDRPTPIPCCQGALALELSPGTVASRLALPQAAASELAGMVARDLAELVPPVQALDLGLLGAHFDPVELLRPEWPLHRELGELVAGAPGRRDASRVIAFGSHEGRLPEALAPDANHVGGALRLLPFVLAGDHDTCAEVGQALEATLLDSGMAQADTALAAQEGFDAQVEHARYLTIHDLCAMMAMQYEHAGLAPLWPLVEAALLEPGREVWLDAPPEPLARHAAGAIRVAMFDIDAWAAAGLAPQGLATGALPQAFDQFSRRQRQFAALLQAHGLRVTFDHVAAGQDPRAVLSA